MCNLNVIVVLEFISRDLYQLFAILLSSKFQNSIFYQHMRPKSGLKFPRPIIILILSKMVEMDIRCKLLNLKFNIYDRFKVRHAHNF